MIEDVSPEITAEMVLEAYAQGLFPMAESADSPSLFWVRPELRGIIPLQNFHVPSRLARTVRSRRFEIRFDSDFEAVISGCALTEEGNRSVTWINPMIRALYSQLFQMGYCHTVESYSDGKLAGGLYGIALKGAFFGESMFHTVRDASKVALVHLVERLKSCGFLLLDAQFITPHLAQFGAIEIERENYEEQLLAALSVSAHFTNP